MLNYKKLEEKLIPKNVCTVLIENAWTSMIVTRKQIDFLDL